MTRRLTVLAVVLLAAQVASAAGAANPLNAVKLGNLQERVEMPVGAGAVEMIEAEGSDHHIAVVKKQICEFYNRGFEIFYRPELLMLPPYPQALHHTLILFFFDQY